jgi:hypothetical protein
MSVCCCGEAFAGSKQLGMDVWFVVSWQYVTCDAGAACSESGNL